MANKLILAYQTMWKYLTFFRYRNGIKVLEREWNNLIILDSCRYDIFERMNTIKGKLTKEISRGSNTLEWIRGNFRGLKKTDIDYISASPYISEEVLAKEIGHNPFNIIDVWNWGWDDSLKVVHPQTMVDAVKSYYKGNRTVIHFLQPHQPFLNGGIIEMSKEEIIKAYERNLEFVLKYVKDLVPILKGKTVIIGDHGECYGEYFLFKHPSVRIKVLREVPWLEVDGMDKENKGVDLDGQ
ncbi:MAG: hypothetical protein HYS62_00950 [Candidatus Aenigmarchaeota archaeon]|nr:hypothetical protein [Candidatus Aenigmarchaeota archaeon]